MSPYLKNPLQKRAGGVAQGVDPEFKLQHQKKKKKKRTTTTKISNFWVLSEWYICFKPLWLFHKMHTVG
jgi:hypothetical protein